jgi:hypothetical protein
VWFFVIVKFELVQMRCTVSRFVVVTIQGIDALDHSS